MKRGNNEGCVCGAGFCVKVEMRGVIADGCGMLKGGVQLMMMRQLFIANERPPKARVFFLFFLEGGGSGACPQNLPSRAILYLKLVDGAVLGIKDTLSS